MTWTIPEARTAISIEGYFAWTFGCYSDTVEQAPIVVDTMPTSRSIRCADTITTSYVGGIQTAVRWR